MAGDSDSDLEDLLCLHEAGTSVCWPPGLSEKEIRRRTNQRRRHSPDGDAEKPDEGPVVEPTAVYANSRPNSGTDEGPPTAIYANF